MFGVSFLEIAVIGLIALIIVGPQKLPGMMRTIGEWLGKLRKMTSDMRKQTGIDDILREEGIDGVAELRTLLRGGGLRNAAMGMVRGNPHSTNRSAIHYTEAPDPLMEFPVEGVDAAGSLPDDLFLEDSDKADTGEEDEGSGSPNEATGDPQKSTESSPHAAKAPPSAAAPADPPSAGATPTAHAPGSTPQQK